MFLLQYLYILLDMKSNAWINNQVSVHGYLALKYEYEYIVFYKYANKNYVQKLLLACYRQKINSQSKIP